MALSADAGQFFTTHQDVWEWIVDYQARYGSVPNADTVKEQFSDFDIVKTSGETGHYVDELRNEFINGRIESIMRNGSGKHRRIRGATLLQQLTKELAGLEKVTAVARDVDITDVDMAADQLRVRRQLADSQGGMPGIPTGIGFIDAFYPTGFAAGHFVVVVGWSSHGKEQPVSEPVLTPGGWVRNGDLQVGDEVVGSNGQAIKVTGVFPQGPKRIYNVVLDDGSVVRCGKDHLWTLLTPEQRSPITMTTAEIIKRKVWCSRPDVPVNNDEARWLLPLPDAIEYPSQEFAVEPYTMGVLLSSGSLSEDSIRFTTSEEHIANMVNAETPGRYEQPYKTFMSRRGEAPDFVQAAKQAGVHGLKSRDKFIPEEYFYGSVEQRKALLSALMDCDGSVVPKTRAMYHSYSKKLASDVRQLVLSLGGVARVDTVLRSDGDTEYRVSIWTPFNPFTLPRKADSYSPRPWFRAIRSIEVTEGYEEQQCISVDAADSLYVTTDYVLTHNTWAANLFAARAWAAGFKPMTVSLEMTPEEQRDRLYTIMGSGLFKNSDFARGAVNIDSFEDWGKDNLTGKHPFTIISNEGMGRVTPSIIQGKIDKYKPDIVFIDYVQLLDSDDGDGGNETVKVRNVSKALKRMAMANNIPIVGLAQATSKTPADTDEPPRIEQVAWSRGIQQDANLALAVHKYPSDPGEEAEFAFVARKNRHGELFDGTVWWDLDKGIIREEL